MKKHGALIPALCILITLFSLLGCSKQSTGEESSIGEESMVVSEAAAQSAVVQLPNTYYDSTNNISCTFPVEFSAEPSLNNSEYLVFAGDNPRNYITYSVKTITEALTVEALSESIRGQYPNAEIETVGNDVVTVLVLPSNDGDKYNYLYSYIGTGRLYRIEMSCTDISEAEFRQMASLVQIRSGQ